MNSRRLSLLAWIALTGVAGSVEAATKCYPKKFSTTTVDGTVVVTDAATLLNWQRDPDPGLFTFTTAKVYCQNLGAGWRVPSIKELATLVDYSIASPGPMIDSVAFPGTYTDHMYWTSSQSSRDPGAAGGLDFSTGSARSQLIATTPGHVRCVR